jgi:MFS family permease
VDPRSSRLLLPLLFTGVLMGALDLAIVGPALPAIEAEFGMTPQQLSVLFNAYVLCQMLGTPLLAKVGDRVGARRAYVASIALFAAGSALLVVATTPALLYVGRAVQGFGAGGIFPIAAAVIGNTLPPKERGPALGILGTVFGLAFIIGPVLGGLLLPFGWHWLFAINLPIAAVLAAGAFRLLPGPSAGPKKPVDSAGIVVLATLLAAFVIGMDRLDPAALGASLGTWPVAGAFALVAVLLPVFWRIEQRATDPIIRPGLFRSRPVVTAALIGTGVGAIQAAGGYYPALAVGALGVSQSTAAWLQLPGVLVATAASPVAGRLINSVGTRTLIAAGMALVAASLLIFGLAELTIPVFVAASVLANIGLGGVLGAPLRMVMLDNCAPGERGAAQGLLSNFSSVGRLLGAAFVGMLAARVGGGAPGYQAAFVGVAVVAAGMAALGLTLDGRRVAVPA